MATKTVQNAFLPQRSGTLPSTELVTDSSEDAESTLLTSQQRGNQDKNVNGVKKIAGIIFTPEKEAFAQRILMTTELTSPVSRKIVARQASLRSFPTIMGALSPSATLPRKVYTTPNSVRTVSRILGKGTQGEVLLTHRIFNDSQSEPQEEALKIYDRRCQSWELMKEISENERTFINLPSKVYPIEDGKYAAVLPLAETDLAHLDLSREWNPIQKLLGWMRDVAQGVEVMHRHNIIHRDLKPANILVLKGLQAAQVADLDLAAKVVEGEHFTTCTPYYSHPSIWGNDIMMQKMRKGIQTKADDVYSLGRTVQYGMIAKIFGMHEETKNLAKAMRPEKIDLPLDEQEADEALLKLVAEKSGNVMISGLRRISDPRSRTGYRYIPSVVHVFPSRAMLRAMTLCAIEELRGKMDRIEFEALRLVANLAHDLQNDHPAHRPSMEEARLQIEANQVYLGQISMPFDFPDLQVATSSQKALEPSTSIPARSQHDEGPHETKRIRYEK